jgi:type III secretion protein J
MAMNHHLFRFIRRLAPVLLVLGLAGCKVDLYSGLTEQEANEILAVLAGDHITASKERSEGGDWQVKVEESRLGAALDLLRSQGLPHDRYVSMGDVFQKQGLVSTPAEERMRYIYAVSQELSQTLRSVDGVVSARVHVVIPANDPLSDKIRPSSAAVFIKYRPDVDLRLLAPAVKDMVAHSIEGLSHDQVSLSLFEAKRPAPPPAETAAAAAPVLGVLTTQTTVVIIGALLAAALCLLALPWLAKRQGLEWRDWLRAQWARR